MSADITLPALLGQSILQHRNLFLTLFTENACRLHRKLKAPLPSDSAYGFLNIIQVLNTHEEIREKNSIVLI